MRAKGGNVLPPYPPFFRNNAKATPRAVVLSGSETPSLRKGKIPRYPSGGQRMGLGGLLFLLRSHSMLWILILLLILLLIGSLPTWPYSGGWGYYPSGIVGFILLILIILLLLGYVPR